MSRVFDRHQLRALRRARSLNQAQLAELAGCGRDTISSWERGFRRPMANSLAPVAGVLGAAVDDFFVDLGEEAME